MKRKAAIKSDSGLANFINAILGCRPYHVSRSHFCNAGKHDQCDHLVIHETIDFEIPCMCQCGCKKLATT